jgi:hypothetical protein
MDSNENNTLANAPAVANTENGSAPVQASEEVQKPAEDGTAEQYEAQQSEALTRKQQFREELQAICNKFEYAPIVKWVYGSFKGPHAGIVLADLKNGEHLSEDFHPSWEDEKIMQEIIEKATVGIK